MCNLLILRAAVKPHYDTDQYTFCFKQVGEWIKKACHSIFAKKIDRVYKNLQKYKYVWNLWINLLLKS